MKASQERSAGWERSSVGWIAREARNGPGESEVEFPSRQMDLHKRHVNRPPASVLSGREVSNQR